MKSLKNMSDELWLGLMFTLGAVWLFALNHSYFLISSAFLLAGIFFLIIDGSKRLEKGKKETSSQKAEKK